MIHIYFIIKILQVKISTAAMSESVERPAIYASPYALIFYAVVALLAAAFYLAELEMRKKSDTKKKRKSEHKPIDSKTLNSTICATSSPVNEDQDYVEELKQEGRLLSNLKSGSTENYDWLQTESDIELYFHLQPNNMLVDKKDIKVIFSSTKLEVFFQGRTLIAGRLYASVIADECNWQLDDTAGNTKRLWITLTKKIPTIKKNFWRYIIANQVDCDNSATHNAALHDTATTEEANSIAEPFIYDMDTSNPGAIKNAIRHLKANI